MPRLAAWEKVAINEQLRRSSLCMATVGTTVYTFGGELEPRRPRDNDICYFDIDKRSKDVGVRTIPAGTHSPSPRVGSAMAKLNGRIYMFSGRGGEAMAPIDEQGQMWVFDPSSEHWSALLPSTSAFPEARSYHSMIADGHDLLYLHAGCPEQGRLADLWEFSISRAEWRQLASAPGPPRGGTSIAFDTGKLYRMNGFDGKTEQGGNLDIYDLIDNSWTSVSFLADGQSGPGPRSVAALLPVHGHGSTLLVTLFGESDPSSLGHKGAGKMLSDVWAYRIEDGTWTQLDTTNKDIPLGRGWFDADTVQVDGRDAVIIVGGLGEDNERLDDAWLLTFE